MDQDQGSRSGESIEPGLPFEGLRGPVPIPTDTRSTFASDVRLPRCDEAERVTDSELLRLKSEMSAVKARLMESKAALARAAEELRRSEAARLAAASDQETLAQALEETRAAAAIREELREAELSRLRKQLSRLEPKSSEHVPDDGTKPPPERSAATAAHASGVDEASKEIERLNRRLAALEAAIATRTAETSPEPEDRVEDADPPKVLVPDWEKQLANAKRFAPEPARFEDLPRTEDAASGVKPSAQDPAFLRVRADWATESEDGRPARSSYRSASRRDTALRASPARVGGSASKRSALRVSKLRAFGEALAVAGLAALVVASYPGGDTLFAGLRPQIEAISEFVRMPAFAWPFGSPAPAATAAPLSVATVESAANLRATPSIDGAVTSVLSPGTQVEELERRGAWTHVRLAGAGGGRRAVEGWVAGRLLKTDSTSR